MRQRLIYIFMVVFPILMFSGLSYAGLNLAFEIPTKTITIDGEPYDWVGIDPVINDPQGDSLCIVGTDIKAVYLAVV